MYIKILFLVMISLFQVLAIGQSPKRSLQIGDTLPGNVVLSNMRNWPSKKAELSDFKKKLIILDFWNRACKACIAAFPKMEDNQLKHDKDIQILLVTDNKENELKSLFEKSKIMQSTKLPFVIGNSELYEYFPHTVEPFHVWIDSNGVVIAITDGYNTTSKHITKYLKTGRIDLIPRQDADIDFNANLPILINNPILSRIIAQQSSFFTRLTGVETSSSSLLYDSISKETIGIRFVNMDIIFFFKSAFGFNYNDRIIVRAPDSTNYFPPTDPSVYDEWKARNWFCYELIAPGKSREGLMNIMKQDFERFFGLTGSIQLREVKALVLTKVGDNSLLKTKGGEALAEKAKDGYFFRNVRLEALIARIRGSNRRNEIFYPVLNETQYNEKVDMVIKGNMTDIVSLNTELAKYGLKLIEAYRTIEMLVLEKTSNNKN